jgi:hypothetical protein
MKYDVLTENREFDACALSYGVSACKQISLRMTMTLPRELRDLIYQNLQESYTEALQAHVEGDEEASSEFNRNLNDAIVEAKSTTPIDLRFSFLKRHHFRASYMGVDFVKEEINAYFRSLPFKVQAEELNGHQEFFLSDKFGLGSPLGELLGRVEVLITTLHFRMTDTLQSLMAIGNTDCLIVLTASKALINLRNHCQEEAIASSQQLLQTIALNLRRMTLKGYPVIVRYQDSVIFTANEKDDVQDVSNSALVARPTE